MNSTLSRLLLLLIIVGCGYTLKAQDEHFSQFYAMPIHMNPALTGAYDGTYRATMVYRDQWNNTLESAYKTFAAGGDTRLNMKIRKRKTEDKIGIGLFFVSDKVAEFQSNTNQISSYFAYHKRLGKKNPSYLAAGIKMGVIQHNINYDNLTFEDQFDQIDQYSNPTSEILPPNNYGTLDASIGVNYYVQLPKSTFYIGGAYHHFNKPSYSYFSRLNQPNPSIDISQTLLPKTVFHASMDRQLKYALAIQPRVVYQKQGEHNQVDIGSNMEYTFKSRESAFILGLWLSSVNDLDGFRMESITPLVGIRQKKFIIGLSYDVGLTDVNNSVFRNNSLELSIRFSGEVEQDGAFCPTF